MSSTRCSKMRPERSLPLNKNDRITLWIDSLNHEGQGIGRQEQYVVFVPGALPGETVTAHIIKTTAHYAVGKLLSVEKLSPERAAPACPCYARCGGCTLQHWDYEAQRRWKKQLVADAFAKIAGMPEIPLLDTVGMENPWEYRNKGAFPFAQGEEKEIGLYSAHSHRVVPVQGCLLQRPLVMKAAQTVLLWARQENIPLYDEKSHSGILREAVIRCDNAQTQVMVTVVTTGKLPAGEKLVQLLKENIPELASVYHNINAQMTNVILGPRSHLLYGRETVDETLCGLKFAVSPHAFLQVNTAQAQKLYTLAREMAALKPNEKLLDAYCGVGTIGQTMAADCAEVLGIECVEKAVEDARSNAKRNGIANARYLYGEAEKLLEAVREFAPDVALLDPPRKGCDAAFLNALAACAPKRIVYISCNPATLARDAALLKTHGYELKTAVPVDMFPQTTHVETVCLFE